MKSEPKVYSLEQLISEGQTIWDGVRNYQARNFLLQMRRGDLAFFYHSNISCPAIVGLVTVVADNIIDPSQFALNSPYYDPKATPQSPRWYTVMVEFKAIFPYSISLKRLKQEFKTDELLLNRRGNRLSVIPVHNSVAQKILAMALDKIDK